MAESTSIYADPRVEAIYPVVAKHINDHGGAVLMRSLLADPELKALQKKLPVGDLRYSLTKMIAQEPDYFTMIHGKTSFVATALGYQQEYLDLDGNLTQAGLEHLDKQKEQLSGFVAPARMMTPPVATADLAMNLDVHDTQEWHAVGKELDEMAEKLCGAILRGTDRDLDAIVKAALECRRKHWGTDAPPSIQPAPVKPPENERIQMNAAQLRMAERMMRLVVKRLEKEPSLDLPLTMLQEIPTVANLMSALSGAPLLELFTVCYPEYFSEYIDDTDGRKHICLKNFPPAGNIDPVEMPFKPTS